MRTQELARAALFAALIAICSWISIPTAVPFTLQTFAVFLALGVLGGKLGTLSVAVYLLLGAVGLPVFAGFQGGLGALLGATGGYLAGFLLTLLAGAAASLLGWWIYLDMFYVNMSMFFAFATLYPDMQVLFFFIIPVKVKWLAWLDAAMYAIRCAMYIAGGSWVMCLLPLAAVANYLLFFWSDIMERFGRVKYRASRQTINFKQAAKKAQQQKGYIHKCAVCGKTDTDYPDEEFRYCSKCNGYYCYCSEHIHNHVHIE